MDEIALPKHQVLSYEHIYSMFLAWDSFIFLWLENRTGSTRAKLRLPNKQ